MWVSYTNVRNHKIKAFNDLSEKNKYSIKYLRHAWNSYTMN